MGADRIELITRVERRRHWPVDDKADLVAETWESGKSFALIVGCQTVSLSRQRIVLALLSYRFQWLRRTAPAWGATSAMQRCGLIEIDLGDGRQVRVDPN